MLHKLEADLSQPDDEKGYTGRSWLASLSRVLQNAPNSRDIHFDLSNLRSIALFEWLSFIAIVDAWTTRHSGLLRTIGLDFTGGDSASVVTKEECIRHSKGVRTERLVPEHLFELAEHRRRLLGFVECQGTSELLSIRDSNEVEVIYPFLGRTYGVSAAYVNKSDPTVLSGIQPVRNEQDCRSMLEDSQIQQWKSAMAEEFKEVPYFVSSELWRCFFFELSSNIVDHVDTRKGFLTGRVVRKNSFPVGRLGIWPHGQPDCVELCVADAGLGIAQTLKSSFASEYPDDPPIEEHILLFAFGPRGSRKKAGDRFLQCRHALARILSKVEKYAGVLRVRTGNWEFVFDFSINQTVPNNKWGRTPTEQTRLPFPIPGTHIQMVLPLIPRLAPTPDVHSLTLPTMFGFEPLKPIGHLVPLSERLGYTSACLTPKETDDFVAACAALVNDLVEDNVRPAGEAIVLDCSDLGSWRWEQLAGLLLRLQYAIVGRPVLLVEAPKHIVRATQEAERDGDVLERMQVSPDQMGHIYDSSIWCVDSLGANHILGLHGRDALLEGTLLSLLDHHQTIDQLASHVPELSDAAARLRALLPHNPLFVRDGSKWRPFWSKAQLSVEATRAVTLHFSQVALRSVAWRGCPSRYRGVQLSDTDRRVLSDDKDEDVFCLPWKQQPWVDEFLECRRIFARERQVDEIAQRLVHRVGHGLSALGRPLESVGILAVSTAPALMLATAMHKWWQSSPRPRVVDLGYHLLRAPEESLPALAGEGDIVVVQDVLDDRVVTAHLLQKLAQQRLRVTMVISFVRFEPHVAHESGWLLNHPESDWGPFSSDQPVLRRHSMFSVQRPKCTPHDTSPTVEHSYWVEPHSLRPFRYSDLVGRSRSWETQLPHFVLETENGGTTSMVRAGHFAYGTRHYGVTVDVRSFLHSARGDAIAHEIADICCGIVPGDCPLQGDVTMVIMPLHSQVHYLWRKVENVLARRGRRTFYAYVEAALFLGHGPAYRFPEQVLAQIELGAIRRAQHPQSESGVRVLILDDATISGQTLETILDQLHRTAQAGLSRLGDDSKQAAWPFEWIRAYVVFGQMPHATRSHWLSLDHIRNRPGSESTKFLYQDRYHLPGLPIHEVSDCPLCKHHEMLSNIADECTVATVSHEASILMNRVRVVSIDGGLSGDAFRDVVKFASDKGGLHRAMQHPDIAVWQFCEMMYRTHPVDSVLRGCKQQIGRERSTSGPALPSGECEARREFRTFVYSWCLSHWARVKAMAAQAILIECLHDEISAGTGIPKTIAPLMAVHSRDAHIKECVGRWLAQIAEGDTTDAPTADKPITSGVNLSLALYHYACRWYGHPKWEVSLEDRKDIPWDDALVSLVGDDRGWLAHSLLFLSRDDLHPGAALRVLCEHLFRGRWPSNNSAHIFLPGLLSEFGAHPSNEFASQLLSSALATFSRALSVLCKDQPALRMMQVALQYVGTSILDLRANPRCLPTTFSELKAIVDLGESYCEELCRFCHRTLSELVLALAEFPGEANTAVTVDLMGVEHSEAKGMPLLAPFDLLVTGIHNWGSLAPALLPHGDNMVLTINVVPARREGAIHLRILGKVNDRESTLASLESRRNWMLDRSRLQKYDVQVEVTDVTANERALGFLSALQVSVPEGFGKGGHNVVQSTVC